MTEIIIWYDYDEVGDEWIVVSYVYWDGDVGREQSHLAVRTGDNIEAA